MIDLKKYSIYELRGVLLQIEYLESEKGRIERYMQLYRDLILNEIERRGRINVS